MSNVYAGVFKLDCTFANLNTLHKDLMSQVLKRVSDAFQKYSNELIGDLYDIAMDRVTQSSVFNEIYYENRLQWELGILNPQEKIAGIFHEWLNSARLYIQTSTDKQRNSKLSVHIAKSNFEDVLASKYATQNTDDMWSNPPVKVLEWLSWLLMSGTRNIVVGYRFSEAPGKGRTGGGYMFQSDGVSWGINPAYAGTKTNNFITKALNTINDDDVYKVALKVLRKAKLYPVEG